MSTTQVDLFVPGLGESVTEARIANWVKTDGDSVVADDVVLMELFFPVNILAVPQHPFSPGPRPSVVLLAHRRPFAYFNLAGRGNFAIAQAVVPPFRFRQGKIQSPCDDFFLFVVMAFM